MGFVGGLKLCPNNVIKDDMMKQAYKDFLNSLTGKFSQKRKGSRTVIVDNQAALEKLFHQKLFRNC